MANTAINFIQKCAAKKQLAYNIYCYNIDDWLIQKPTFKHVICVQSTTSENTFIVASNIFDLSVFNNTTIGKYRLQKVHATL